MTGDLPTYSIDDLDRAPVLDVAEFTNDDAVDLGLAAVEVIDERALNLAVRVVLRGDIVFQAKFGSTGAGNDAWLAGKHAVVERFGEPSLLVRRRHEEAGTPFEELPDIDHEAFKAHGGSIPIKVNGETVGSITTSGEPDVVDHATSAEAIRRYLAR
ncbi:heme-binding protein [Pseudolysinimonas sp.]|uniref:heme-binding protein n=1 Tax=Pseudolysinimonas sp. TaxID=2680009 RepID=UPI00286A164A|nr:heme-binding protein [Pseudolysinimonas sp.]